MRRATCFSILLVVTATLVYAAPNSPRRVQAFARLPDWTGLWETSLSKNCTTASGRCVSTSETTLQLAAHPPFTPEWEQKYQVALAAAKAAGTDGAPKGCGEGAPEYVKSFPNIMEGVMIFQVVVTPEETLFVMDHGEVRHIYTDGRGHPGKDDIWQTLLGDSIGHWDGQTLVIDTVARTPGPISMWAPVAELSEQAHFTERVRRIGKAVLEDQLTIEDPVRFVRPWTVTLHYSRVTDLTRFLPYDCEADRNPLQNGKFSIAPPKN